jgi:hypothetical protein
MQALPVSSINAATLHVFPELDAEEPYMELG